MNLQDTFLNMCSTYQKDWFKRM